ncbi:hypothetical protein [Rhizobium leguminosarum]|uniref:hypothetical protein n=1 Tax=Rhizobium leguminosarum TaxID=384 RepID=UPI0039657800
MATMLGVRRSSVTKALHILEGEHFIYSHRGLVIIRNRASLEAFADDAYDVPGARPRSALTDCGPVALLQDAGAIAASTGRACSSIPCTAAAVGRETAFRSRSR